MIRLFRRLAAGHPRLQAGIGDDAAVIRPRAGRLLWTTDLLVENTHFRRGWMKPEDLGWKAAAVSLSDIAAMAGTPEHLLLACGLPRNISIRMALGIFRGVREAARRFRCSIAGGDLVRSERIVICTAAIGFAARPVLRRGARAGDDIWASGPLGEARAGLEILKRGGKAGRPWQKRLVQRFLRPMPRVALGLRLAGISSAMLDDSDGLAKTVRLLAEENGLEAVLEEARLPLSPHLRRHAGRRAAAYALCGGEDYGLVCAAAPSRRKRLAGLGLARIGFLRKGFPGRTWIRRPGRIRPEPLRLRTFEHF